MKFGIQAQLNTPIKVRIQKLKLNLKLILNLKLNLNLKEPEPEVELEPEVGPEPEVEPEPSHHIFFPKRVLLVVEVQFNIVRYDMRYVLTS